MGIPWVIKNAPALLNAFKAASGSRDISPSEPVSAEEQQRFLQFLVPALISAAPTIIEAFRK